MAEILKSDWDSSASNVLAYDWRNIGFNVTYLIWQPAVANFRKKVQKLTRTSGTSDIAVASNDFGIGPTYSNYFVEFWYRSTSDLVLYRLEGTNYHNPNPYGSEVIFTPSPSIVQYASSIIIGDGLAFNGIAIKCVRDKGGSGTTLWFELDRVSCRAII